MPDIKKKNLLLIGAYPPPVGGNSVHIQRLHKLLCSVANIQVHVLDMYNKTTPDLPDYVTRVGPPGMFSVISALKVIYSYKPAMTHFHVSAMGRFVAVGFILLLSLPFSRKIITIHSGSFVEQYRNSSIGKRFWIRKLLTRFDQIVVVGTEQKKLLIEVGFAKNKIIVLPAFLPATTQADTTVQRLLSEAKSKNLEILVTSGSGVKLYGFDLIINAITSNSSLYSSTSLIICLYNNSDEDYVKYLKSLINPQHSILILRDLSPEKFAYLLKRSKGYIRATDRDGDSVAIREARSYGIPVLASDVVQRPEYCHLFDLNSNDSLTDGILQLLSSPVVNVESNSEANLLTTILNLYNSEPKFRTSGDKSHH